MQGSQSPDSLLVRRAHRLERQAKVSTQTRPLPVAVRRTSSSKTPRTLLLRHACR